MKGCLEQQSGERIAFPTLVGKWDEAMTAVLADGSSRVLWKKEPPPADPTRCFSRFLFHQEASCFLKSETASQAQIADFGIMPGSSEYF